jgi:hypothetical protein
MLKFRILMKMGISTYVRCACAMNSIRGRWQRCPDGNAIPSNESTCYSVLHIPEAGWAFCRVKCHTTPGKSTFRKTCFVNRIRSHLEKAKANHSFVFCLVESLSRRKGCNVPLGPGLTLAPCVTLLPLADVVVPPVVLADELLAELDRLWRCELIR